MNLICPECKLTKSASVVPVRLELCVRCERDGRPSYLVPGPEASTRNASARQPSTRRRG